MYLTGHTTMKNTLRNSLLFVGLLLAASLSFAQTYVKFTTLASAITSSSSQSNTFSLTSVSGITANNTMLFIEGEADFVNAVNTVANTVSVTRGAGFSTRVSTHPSGATVWYSYPYNFQAQTPVGYPFGSCTRANLVLPYIDVINNVFSDCLGGVWVRGISASTAAVIFAPDPGGSVLTGVGTSTATTNTSMYCSQIFLPYNKKLTGLQILNGATVTNGHRDVILYDASGNLLANSGTTTTTAGSEHLPVVRLHHALLRGGAGLVRGLLAGGIQFRHAQSDHDRVWRHGISDPDLHRANLRHHSGDDHATD